MQDVLNGGGVEIGCGRGPALGDELEFGLECLHRSGYAVAACAAQFDEVVTRGKGDEKPAIILQNAPEFARIHPRRDRQDEGEGPAGIRHKAIGIRHDPLALGVAPRRGVDGRN